jgi:hypothetical protein
VCGPGGCLNGSAETVLLQGVGLVREVGTSVWTGAPYETVLVSTSRPLPPPDADCDGVADSLDNCVNEPNADQLDSGGVGSAVANDIGDVCECGDGSDDGIVNLLDPVLLWRALAGRGPGLAAPEKCAVEPTGACDGLDVAVTRMALAGLSPGIAAVCDAALP